MSQRSLKTTPEFFLTHYTYIQVKKSPIDLYSYITNNVKRRYQYFINFNKAQMLGMATNSLQYEHGITHTLSAFFKNKISINYHKDSLLNTNPVSITSSLELCGGLVGYIDFYQAAKHIPMFYTSICQNQIFAFKSSIVVSHQTDINLAWKKLVYRNRLV